MTRREAVLCIGVFIWSSFFGALIMVYLVSDGFCR